jgi:hypothetical protein
VIAAGGEIVALGNESVLWSFIKGVRIRDVLVACGYHLNTIGAWNGRDCVACADQKR